MLAPALALLPGPRAGAGGADALLPELPPAPDARGAAASGAAALAAGGAAASPAAAPSSAVARLRLSNSWSWLCAFQFFVKHSWPQKNEVRPNSMHVGQQSLVAEVRPQP